MGVQGVHKGIPLHPDLSNPFSNLQLLLIGEVPQLRPCLRHLRNIDILRLLEPRVHLGDELDLHPFLLLFDPCQVVQF
jgi:hypothetical protein